MNARDDAGGSERAALRRDPGRRIEADGILRLAGVEVAHLIDARARDGVEDVLGEVAVRIDDGDAFACINVAHCEVEEKRALARAGFADDPDVALTLLAREDDRDCRLRRSLLRNRLWLHNVAPASGENADCQLQPAFAVVRSSLLVEVGTSAARRATHGEV